MNPILPTLDPETRAAIVRDFDGTNLLELSTRYDCSLIDVHQIIGQAYRDNPPEPANPAVIARLINDKDLYLALPGYVRASLKQYLRAAGQTAEADIFHDIDQSARLEYDNTTKDARINNLNTAFEQIRIGLEPVIAAYQRFIALATDAFSLKK